MLVLTHIVGKGYFITEEPVDLNRSETDGEIVSVNGVTLSGILVNTILARLLLTTDDSYTLSDVLDMEYESFTYDLYIDVC